MPKTYELADLHRHIDGSLRIETLKDCAMRAGLPAPKVFRFTQGMALADALAMFDTTVCAMQTLESLKRIASEICEDAAEDRVTTLELRFAPHLHMHAAGKQRYTGSRLPLSADDEALRKIIGAVVEGVQSRAGLILCGLYGDDPQVLEHFVDLAIDNKAIVGIDLAGAPLQSHQWGIEDYADAFSYAKRRGIGTTAHLGEGRPHDEVEHGIETLNLDRVGHATSALPGTRALAMIKERGITIEACPTSNIQLGLTQDHMTHPISDWMYADVKVAICTDNTMFSGITSSQEHLNVLLGAGWGADGLKRAIRHGHEGAFKRSQ